MEKEAIIKELHDVVLEGALRKARPLQKRASNWATIHWRYFKE